MRVNPPNRPNPPNPPNKAATTAPSARDLSDVDFAELDERLAATPAPFEPFDVVGVDGYLCGVLVQPTLVDVDAWLPYVFDPEGRPLPDDVDAVWLARTRELILRRHAALREALVEDGWFDPFILEPDADEALDESADGSVGSAVSDEDDRPVGLDRTSIALAIAPWSDGFLLAVDRFGDLASGADDATLIALARIARHLPPADDAEREIAATLDEEAPLATLDEAIEDLVAAVVDLHDITEPERYRVETVRRDAPKVGRNDPCPCGSGKKWKHCHGRSAPA